MPQKLVDVFDKKGKLLFTYTIILNGLNYEPNNKEFEQHAIQNAKDDQLGPPDDLVVRVR